jgi:tetratricopeptide (TPR) repeat protein
MLMLHYLAGAPDQAEHWADKLAAAIQERSIPVFESYYLTNVARAKVARGKLAEAKAILDGALAALAPDVVWAHTIIGMAIVYGQIDLAQGEPGRVFDRLDERVDGYRKAGFRYSLAEEYLLRGRAYSALGQVEAARAALQKAKEVAEAQQERVMLWQILVGLSAWEEAYGDRNAAEPFREQARAVVEYIADHAGALRDVFLAQPEVAQLLSKTSPRAVDPQTGLPLS